MRPITNITHKGIDKVTVANTSTPMTSLIIQSLHKVTLRRIYVI